VDEIPEHPRFRNAQTIEELRDQIAADATSSQDSSPTMFWSPLEISQGQKVPLPMVYCDQTASNRPLQSLEQYLQDTCLPFYGNTHTNTSITGAQSTAFCAEARQLVAEAVNAKTTGKASQDVVLFAGNGTTSAVELLLDCLGFHHHVSNSSSINATPNAVTNTTNNKPIVFIGPFEHHSNLLPWRESGAEIVMIPERNGHVDLVAMEHLLKKHQSIDAVKIGAFTAASNVTGIVADTNAITAMLHQYGALAIWDYATGAPYLDMNMNPMDDPRYASNPAIVAKDALFFSPHKMVGGINTPGVLVVKKRLVQQMNAPRRSGGGTVFYVTQDHHRFLSNRIERYEGGTPNVVGIWRVGLTMLFKRQIQNKYAQLVQNQSDDNDDDDDATIPPTVLDYEYRTFERVATALRKIPNLVLLGDDDDDDSTTTKKRLPIFSFLIKSGRRFLHYNYVCALLNDIFGIQSRGGCQCAGPYSQRLLGLTEISSTDGMQESPSPINEQIESALLHAKERAELLRPGFTRLSLPFKGVSSQQVDYVVKAIGWIARNGWVLLPSYRCNHRTGEWRHKQRQGAPLGKRERLWLSHYSFTSSPPPPSQNQHGSSWSAVLEETMQTADKLLELARNDTPGIQQALKMTDEASGGMGDSDTALEELRWYVYPKEVAAYVAQGLEEVPGSLDRSNLLGALRPLAWYPKKPVPPQEHIEANSHMIATPDVELFNLEQSSTEQQHQHQHQHQQQQEQEQEQEQTTNPDTNQQQQEQGQETAPTFSCVSFKDGEHSGEASREEIVAGYDDGELSDDCLIFDSKSDDWINIREFVGVGASADPSPNGSPSPPDEPEVPEAISTTETPAPTPTPTQSVQSHQQKAPLVLPIDEKNQKKKPSRDSTSWGQGTFVPITAPEASMPIVPATNDAESTVLTALSSHTEAQASRRKGTRHIKPTPKMMRLVTQATVQWDMLKDGDRLLLGLSGGKDSLSLLHILMEFQRKLPIKFEIEVCTIDPMTPSFDPSPLIPYVESLGLKYHYIKDDIVDRANSAGENGQMVSSLCAFCARMKRGLLYATARKHNCNKLVLAQHLDDLAESFMMSVMHNGFLRTMKANYEINAGDLAVIRPLVYCRENLTTEFAKSNNLPVINENCPACFEEPKERARIKKLLQREESMYPNFYDNIKRSLIPLMHDDTTAILRAYTEEAVAKSRKIKNGKKGATNQDKRNGGSNSDKQPMGAAQPVETDAETAIPHVGIALGDKDLAEASIEELTRALAKRKADKFRLSGASPANKRMAEKEAALMDVTGIPDPTGMVCSLNGGDGTIPCRELME